MNEKPAPKAVALLPVAVFLVLYLVLGIVLAFGAKSFWERKGYEGEKLTQYVLYTKLAALALVLASVLLGMVF